jgi:dienelactone hydrolase
MLNRRQFCRVACAAASWNAVRRLAAADRRDVAWLADVQRAPLELPPDAPTLAPLLVDAQGQPIQSLDGWLVRREMLRRQWLGWLGSLELDEGHVPALRVLSEDQDAGVVRQLVRYEIEPGVVTEAYLLRPVRPQEKCAGVAVFHSTVNHSILQPAGLGPDAEKAFGLKLGQRGVVAFCPRNFLWPENQRLAAKEETLRFQQRHPRATGMAKMLYDARIAVNVLAGLPEVDPARIGAAGHSLGAKEVLYLAAFDERVRVTVSSEGGIGTTFSNWDAPWYLGPSIKQPGFSREHHELLALAAPRPFLLIGGDSADGDRGWPFIRAALPVYQLYGDPPRLGFYNHKQGHTVPAESERRIYEWFETYL